MIFVILYLIFALVFAISPLILVRLIAPKKPGKIKEEPYECGVEVTGDSWIRFGVQYYIYALLFVIFDIEVIFLFPIATVYKDFRLLAFIEILIFLSVLIVGLIYAWNKKAFRWE